MNSRIATPNRTRINSSFLWLAATQFIAVCGAWAVAAGDNIFRFFALGSVTGAMLISLLVSLETGLMAMILFEPFRGFLRRVQYLVVPYSQSEPIHLITPVVTFAAFLLLLQRQTLDIFRATPLAGAVSILAAIYFAQIFNPLQGSLFVGLTGALFFLVPVAWFYFGQAAKPEFVPKVLRVVVLLGMIASFYGVYQMVFGYPTFEQYWIDNTDFYSSIAVNKVTRALATFNSAEEWGRYVQLACIVAFGLGIMKTEGGKRLFWLSSGVVLIVMLALTGQRSAIFGMILGIVILFLTGARSPRGIFARICLLFAPLLLISALSSYVGDEQEANTGDGESVNTMLSHTTQGTVKPTGEGSLYARFNTWSRIITRDLPANPIGNGIGADGLAAYRETNNTDDPTDNHILSVALSAGVPAALILIWIFIRSLVMSFRLWRYTDSDSAEYGMWRIALALMASFLLNNFFGTSFTIYSVAPVGWLVIGWISAAYWNKQNDYEPSDSDQGETRFAAFN
jgi:hypothetical protein